MTLGILSALVAFATAFLALKKDYRAALGAKSTFGLSKPGAVLLGLALVAATAGIGQAVQAHRNSEETKRELQAARKQLTASEDRERKMLANSRKLNDDIDETRRALGEARERLDDLGRQLNATLASLEASEQQQESLIRKSAELEEALQSAHGQVVEARAEIQGLQHQLMSLRDTRVRALEGEVAKAVSIGRELAEKADYSGRLTDYFNDLRSDPGNLPHAINDLRNLSNEMRSLIDQLVSLG